MDEFEFWWKNYPKKLAKGDARKAWKQTEKIRPSLDRLLKALVVAKSSDQWTKDGGQFIPYPATWLRGERWDDVHEIELSNVVNGKMWWETVSGIEAKASELNFGPWDPSVDRTYKAYTERLKRLAGGNVVSIKVA